MDTTDTTDMAVERGSGNVFADLDLPDADAHLVKAGLVSRIDDIVRKRGITRAEAARLLGLTPPDVSRLLRGDFREYSLERLFRLPTALGRDIDSQAVIGVNHAMRAGGRDGFIDAADADFEDDPNSARSDRHVAPGR